ncbi:MAG: hypothetical protein J6Y70_00060 [Bacilli bacterium]|nr:hypothetical protein [Bacilli bacterium]
MPEKNIFFKKGVLFYKEINKALTEILDTVAKNKKKSYNVDDFQKDFNYITQYFLFNLAIPDEEDKCLSFSELLYIVDIGNLNSRLDFAINDKNQMSQQVFLVVSEKTKNEIKKFNKKMRNYTVNLRKTILKIFKQFDKIQKKKNSAYDKIIILLANVIESFLNLKEKNSDNNLKLSIAKKTKKFFFNI